jgi:geranylgeranyl diphosphate synthase type II
MRYAVGTGGKRIRPLIALGAAMAAGGKAGDAAYPAAAIELLHNYTLVHDDLPSMDNDEMRRGNPTVWKKFGEVNAILAGDALQALAFSAAAKTPNNAAKVVAALADAGVGVVAGQVEDIAATGDTAYIYEHKTADLFVAAAAMGALAASADGVSLSKLKSFALNLGLAFQYQDDLIDGDSPYSREETERLAAETTDRALAALENLPGDASVLKELASRLLGRSV